MENITHQLHCRAKARNGVSFNKGAMTALAGVRPQQLLSCQPEPVKILVKPEQARVKERVFLKYVD